MTTTAFGDLFEAISGFEPHRWQQTLGSDSVPRNRLIRVPTGMGKTEGALCAWLWNAVRPTLEAESTNSNKSHGDLAATAWPRRLAWCLPMRVLVEQTADRARELIGQWAEKTGCSDPPKVNILMGGKETERWYLEPEKPAVLIGTQDMLLSRALNRGYASARARWPMEYALLNQDCLWVMDEVQLMDVGLATSAQLQAFRDADVSKQLRPCFTWWMSATLQPDWLRSIDSETAWAAWIRNLSVIPPQDRSGNLWDIPKAVVLDAIPTGDTEGFAQRVLREHESMEPSQYGRITLVVCNTVQRTVETHAALCKAGRTEGLELVHSRFRSHERATWRDAFLSREACTDSVDRIIVATQVVEAGVDISAGCLITELAPWPNLVQRFGRCARYGGAGHVVVVDRERDEKSAAPYDPPSLTAAWDALQSFDDIGVKAIEAFEDGLDNDARMRLYPYEPSHLLMRNEFEELYDTTPDLTGADLDISRFIRSGTERDLLVFWDDVARDGVPLDSRQPRHEELCPVPFLAARDWLCGEESKSNRKPKLRGNMRAWLWDWIDGQWVTVRRDMLVPGCVVCAAVDGGGYIPSIGFAPDSREPVPAVLPAATDTLAEILDRTDNQQDGEPLSISEWKTIAFHSDEVADVVVEIAAKIELPSDLVHILTLAARWHDIGKSHPAFQGKMADAADHPRPDRNDLAKGPESAWRKPPGLYVFRDDESERRPAFRHELASAMALFSVLKLYAPQHPALLGPWGEVMEKLGQSVLNPTITAPPPEVQPVLDCTAEQFDLLAYLVASHHGKVRVALHAAPADQDYQPKPGDDNGLPIRGVRPGDILPSISLTANSPTLPELPLTLAPAALGLSFETGVSWRERTESLIQQYSPPSLALLETVIRVADIRASQRPTIDSTLAKEISA